MTAISVGKRPSRAVPKFFPQAIDLSGQTCYTPSVLEIAVHMVRTLERRQRKVIQIDYRNPQPIYEQIADKIEEMALRRVLQPDSQLPSVRQLAMELSINPNTIQRAYSTLEQRGVIYAAKGRGNFVSTDIERLRSRRLDKIKQEILVLAQSARMLGATDAQLQSWIIEKGEEKS